MTLMLIIGFLAGLVAETSLGWGVKIKNWFKSFIN